MLVYGYYETVYVLWDNHRTFVKNYIIPFTFQWSMTVFAYQVQDHLLLSKIIYRTLKYKWHNTYTSQWSMTIVAYQVQRDLLLSEGIIYRTLKHRWNTLHIPMEYDYSCISSATPTLSKMIYWRSQSSHTKYSGMLSLGILVHFRSNHVLHSSQQIHRELSSP